MTDEQLHQELAHLRQRVAQLEQQRARERLGSDLLRRLSVRLSEALDQLPIVTFVCQPLGDYGATYISASVEEVTGYRPEDFTTDPSFWIERVHPDDKQRVLAALPAVLERSHYEHEYRWRIADGSYRWFEALLRTVRDREGNVLHLAGAWRDVTERHEALAERQAGAERATVMLADLPVVIYTCAAGGNFETTYISPNVAQVLGYRPEQFTDDGLFWIDLVHPDDRQQIVASFSRIFKEQQIEYEYRWRHADGRYVWILDLLRLVRKPDGSPSHILGAMHNITSRKQDEQELHDTREEARRLSARLFDEQERAEQQLASHIQEELSQNLAAMRLDLGWLRRQAEDEDRATRNRIDKLIGLLDTTLASMQGVASHLRPTVLDDLGLVPALATHARELERRSGIPIALSVEPPHLHLDRERTTGVYRMVQEALANAVAHAQAERVTVELVQVGDELTVEVEDDGCGISAEQAASRESLGLVALRARAQTLGGDVRIAGARGRGTTVTIRLPVGCQERNQPQA